MSDVVKRLRVVTGVERDREVLALVALDFLPFEKNVFNFLADFFRKLKPHVSVICVPLDHITIKSATSLLMFHPLSFCFCDAVF